MGQLEQIIRTAGQMIKDNPASAVSTKKGQANFVTEWDVKIQRYLIEQITVLYPDAAFFGEEETEGNSHSVSSKRTFFIDPIDGTTNYIFGYSHSCISVGMSVEGRMTAGYVYNPYSDTLYSAERDKGAFLNGKRLHISDSGLGEGIAEFGCARYNEGNIYKSYSDSLFSTVKELYQKSLSVRSGGSAALGICRVASGANVSYLELWLQPYDYAAAGLIVEEAGGVIGQIDGRPITLDKPCSILAGTPKAVEEVKSVCCKYI